MPDQPTTAASDRDPLADVPDFMDPTPENVGQRRHEFTDPPTRPRAPDTAALCGAWCGAPYYAASVRCLLPEGHDGMHLSDNLNGDRFSWEPINFDPFAHTGGNHANV